MKQKYILAAKGIKTLLSRHRTVSTQRRYALSSGLTMVLFLWLLTGWPSTLTLQAQPSTSASPMEQQVEQMLRRLTLDEKLSLMQHRNPAIASVGLQPYSWWNEALHGVGRNGVAQVFPMPIAMAASFNVALVEQVYDFVAKEALRKRATMPLDSLGDDNRGLTFFTPNINIFRDPRWGRGMETYGEDPWLTATMGLACVNGLQGHDPMHPQAAACLKHLAVHSGPEGLRHEFDARVDARDLYTTYLPAFEYIIAHGAVMQVMCGYNRLNGTPCCTNRELLVDVLRHRWHYDGLLVTDCWALNDCWEPDTVILRHRTHATAALAAADAFGSEVDLECGSGLAALRTAVDSGYITEAKIDEHVRRLLRARLLVGTDAAHADAAAYPATTPLNQQVAEQSIVLLKNDGALPLRATGGLRLALVGPNGDDSVMTLGNYNGVPDSVVTIREGLQHWLQQASAVPLLTIVGCDYVDGMSHVSASQWDSLRRCDAIVFAGGLSPVLEGEELPVEKPGFSRGDRTRLELPEVQVQLIRDLKARTGKPVILVLCCGGSIALTNVVDEVDAILVAWYGGQTMGTAVTQALTLESFSFGKLPLTFYRSTAQLPPFADYAMRGRTYRYLTDSPLYAFGYGLAYRDYVVADCRVDTARLAVSGRVRQVAKQHTDGLPASTVVEVYASNADDERGPRTTLVGFARVEVPANGEATFSIPISRTMLRVYDEQQQQMVAPRRGAPITLRVGFASDSAACLLPLIY